MNAHLISLICVTSVFSLVESGKIFKELVDIDIGRSFRLLLDDYFGALDRGLQNTHGLAFLILGINKRCIVYLDWLHRIVGRNSSGRIFGYQEYAGSEKRDCSEYHPFWVRTANTDDLLLIGLKRYGRRIMVQSLINDQINSKLVERAKNGVFWLQMDPLARHLQFLTNEFERGFNYIGAFAIRGKIIIYGHIESRIRFYELIIRRETSTFEPGTDDTTLSVQLLRRRSVTFDQFEDVSKIFVMENLANIVNPKEHPSLYVGVSMNNELKNLSLLTIPARAIIYGLHGKPDSKKDIYNGHVSMLDNVYLARSDRENLPVVGNYIVVTHDFQQQFWSWDMLPLVTSLLKGYTTRLWMNPYRFHRRMAYPHTRHRAIRYHVAEGWLKFLPLLIGNFFVFLLIMFALTWLFSLHQRIAAKFGGVSGSHSGATA